MANQTTLNELVAILENIKDRHFQLNDFGFGTTDEIGEARKMNYPYLWVTTTDGTTFVQGSQRGGFAYMDFELSIIVVDKVNNSLNIDDDLGEDSNNGLEVSSDTLQIINDILSEISTNPFYVRNRISIPNDVTADPVFDQDDGRVNGWIADITIRMPFQLKYCDTPTTQIG